MYNFCLMHRNTARIVPPLIGKRDYSGDPVINESIPTKVPLIACKFNEKKNNTKIFVSAFVFLFFYF